MNQAAPQTSLERRWAILPGIERVPAADAVALTFDDGPAPDATPAVLDALDAVGARATFFVVGSQLEQHGALARETAARGHELALHGYEHHDHDTLTAAQIHHDMARAVWAFEATLGTRPRWFRPPYGGMTRATQAACEELGLETVYWSAIAGDWTPIAADLIAQDLAPDLVGGAIVVLHDSTRLAPRSSAAATAEAVPLIAELARARGLELRPLGELLR